MYPDTKTTVNISYRITFFAQQVSLTVKTKIPKLFTALHHTAPRLHLYLMTLLLSYKFFTCRNTLLFLCLSTGNCLIINWYIVFQFRLQEIKISSQLGNI